MDFNALIAHANKNAQKAQKLLDKEKQVKKPVNKTSDKSNDTVEFIKKRSEEAKQRALQEAQELLEQRRRKQEQLNPKPAAAAASTTTTTNKKVLNNNKPKSAPTTSSSKTGTAATAKSSTLAKTNGSATFKKPAIPPNGATKKPTATFKPQLSYSEMLKLANRLHEEKLKTSGVVASTSSSSTAAAATSSKSNRNEVAKPSKLNQESINKSAAPQSQLNSTNGGAKRYLPGDVRYKNQPQPQASVNNNQKASQQTVFKSKPVVTKGNGSTGSINRKPESQAQQVKTSISGKTTSITTNGVSSSASSANASGLSAWDRAIADLKRKQGSMNNAAAARKRQQAAEYDDYYDEDDEDEHDSDMDSFICDEDEDGDASSSNRNGKNYSKYIREIFKYNPERYKHLNDDDDPSMESSYNDILKEERKSTKYGYLEDLEDMRLEEEEKKRNKLKNKKLKTS